MPSSSDSAIHIGVCESPRSQRQECIYYDKHYQPLAALQTRSTDQSLSDGDMHSPATNTLGVGTSSADKRKYRKRHNIRSRMMRFFGVCTKCNDPNLSLDTTNSTQQQSNSQIPLLEKNTEC